MIVRNVNGTADSTCACGSWLTHWARFSGQTVPTYCPEVSCVAKVELGAHVQNADPNDDGWYIVPMCRAHSTQIGQDVAISNAIRLVSADVASTCGA